MLSIAKTKLKCAQKKSVEYQFNSVMLLKSNYAIKMAIILPTGQWYAPSAVINDKWYGMVLHGIAWYCMVFIVLHSIAWYCMVLHCIALYCMVLHGIAMYCMVLHGIA